MTGNENVNIVFGS